MADIQWDRYPLLAADSFARSWLTIQANLQLAQNTVEAYGRDLEDYFGFCNRRTIAPSSATQEDISLYVRDLTERPSPHRSKAVGLDSGTGLANATIQRRLTVLRLYYDYLIEEHVRQDHPVGRGRYAPGKAFGGHRDRALIPRYHKQPWIPTEDQWGLILQTTKQESLRTRCMFALAYDAALRREELCALESQDIDPARRLIRVRAETTKTRFGRMIPYSKETSVLYAQYLGHRRTLSQARGPLFLSESRRNKAQPISIWTWSKVIHAIAAQAEVPQFTTHTLRHLRLTDLARAGWDLHEIASFAGHRNLQTSLGYIHLSGRELAAKLEQGMHTIHKWRIQTIAEVLA